MQGSEKAGWVKPYSGCDVEEFEHIESAISQLVLRDIGGGLPKPLGDFRLRQPGCLTPRLKELAQFEVTLGVNGLWHVGSPPPVRGFR
jgi:hypothetical protein